MINESKNGAKSPSEMIDERIDQLGDWRGETLRHVRALVKEAEPEVVEEWKWRGVPVWYHNGIICTGETYKEVVKLTFAKGRHSAIRPNFLTPALKATLGVPSTSARASR